MSEPIIIEIPSPTCRARFVLVHVGQCSGTTCGIPRDATPADLLRAGYVPREVPSAEAWKAAHAEAERELIRARAALAEQPDPGTLAHLRADLRDAVKRAEKAERERDEALGRAQSETEWRVRAVSERQDAEAERDTLRAELARLTAPGEGEPTVSWFYDTYCARPESTQQEDCADAYRLGVAHERARGEPAFLARLDEMIAHHKVQMDRVAVALGDEPHEGEHYEKHDMDCIVAHIKERLSPPAKDRATDEARPLREVSAEMEAMRTTHDERERVYVGAIASDEELVTVYRRAAEPLGDEHGVSLRDLVQRYQAHGVLAVAARVRQERCLVAQAVARGWYIYLCPQKNDPSKWDIETGRVIAGRSDGGAMLHAVPAADVPATLARLLGEVEK